jgi:hypothetical protein
MATPTWITLANANQANQAASGTAVSSFSSATDVSPGTNVAGQAFQTAPAQLYPGQQWRFTANGTLSTTSSPGVSLGVYYGGASGSPLCYGSVAAASAWTNAASVPWSLTAMGKLTAVGSATGTWLVMGHLMGLQPFAGGGTTGTATSPTIATPMPVYTAAAQYDTSVAKIITLAATMTASSASNAITVYNWAIEYMTEP